jgi:2-C-methyl-D-erythritol 4-phosphate cytidylyltransferase
MPRVTTSAILLAGGAGVRMGAGLPKALVPLAGRPLLAWSLEVLAAAPSVDEVVVVAPAGHEAATATALGEAVPRKRVVPGGASRAESLMAGLAHLAPESRRVVVHDAARPLLRPDLVDGVLAALEDADGALAAAPLADTLKRAADGLLVAGTLDRSGLWLAQTPQAFRTPVLRAAAAAAAAAGRLDAATDCASLVEAEGGRVRLVPWPSPNPKVTTPADLELAERLLDDRRAGGGLR